jgi:hypothetical protein
MGEKGPDDVARDDSERELALFHADVRQELFVDFFEQLGHFGFGKDAFVEDDQRPDNAMVAQIVQFRE